MQKSERVLINGFWLILFFSVIVNHNKILDNLKLIVKKNLIQLLDILKNIPNIQNAKNHLMICLYNNLENTFIYNKKKNSTLTHTYKRDYPDSFFDSLYANFTDVKDFKKLMLNRKRNCKT